MELFVVKTSNKSNQLSSTSPQIITVAGVSVDCHNLLVAVAVLTTLLAVSLFVVLQNHTVIGFNTDTIVPPDRDVKFTKCYFLLWTTSHNDSYESGSVATVLDDVVKDSSTTKI